MLATVEPQVVDSAFYQSSMWAISQLGDLLYLIESTSPLDLVLQLIDNIKENCPEFHTLVDIVHPQSNTSLLKKAIQKSPELGLAVLELIPNDFSFCLQDVDEMLLFSIGCRNGRVGKALVSRGARCLPTALCSLQKEQAAWKIEEYKEMHRALRNALLENATHLTPLIVEMEEGEKRALTEALREMIEHEPGDAENIAVPLLKEEALRAHLSLNELMLKALSCKKNEIARCILQVGALDRDESSTKQQYHQLKNLPAVLIQLRKLARDSSESWFFWGSRSFIKYELIEKELIMALFNEHLVLDENEQLHLTNLLKDMLPYYSKEDLVLNDEIEGARRNVLFFLQKPHLLRQLDIDSLFLEALKGNKFEVANHLITNGYKQFKDAFIAFEEVVERYLTPKAGFLGVYTAFNFAQEYEETYGYFVTTLQAVSDDLVLSEKQQVSLSKTLQKMLRCTAVIRLHQDVEMLLKKPGILKNMKCYRVLTTAAEMKYLNIVIALLQNLCDTPALLHACSPLLTWREQEKDSSIRIAVDQCYMQLMGQFLSLAEQGDPHFEQCIKEETEILSEMLIKLIQQDTQHPDMPEQRLVRLLQIDSVTRSLTPDLINKLLEAIINLKKWPLWILVAHSEQLNSMGNEIVKKILLQIVKEGNPTLLDQLLNLDAILHRNFNQRWILQAVADAIKPEDSILLPLWAEIHRRINKKCIAIEEYQIAMDALHKNNDLALRSFKASVRYFSDPYAENYIQDICAAQECAAQSPSSAKIPSVPSRLSFLALSTTPLTAGLNRLSPDSHIVSEGEGTYEDGSHVAVAQQLQS